MAVATHVSRVSKEYAPFGYSIMESKSVEITTTASGVADSVATFALTDDADIYIESVTIQGISAVTSHNTNYLTFRVASIASGGGSSVTHSASSTELTDPILGSDIVANTLYTVAATLPVVDASKMLRLIVGKATDNANTNSKTVGVSVRYRRKA